MTHSKFPNLLTPEETSKILGLSTQTLCVWRSVGRYDLPYVKSGRLVRYRLEDIERFIKKRKRQSTRDHCRQKASVVK